MNKLKIYWGNNDIKIVEPSGKIHQSDLNTVDGKNLIDLMFLKKYVGKEIEIYINNPSIRGIKKLKKVDVQDCGVYYFEVL